MKLKIIAILLLIAAIVPFMAACKSSTGPANQGGGVIIEGEGDGGDEGGSEGGKDDGDGGDEGGSEGGSEGGKDDGEGGGGENDDQSNRPDIPVENADILALSYARLEKADLSFNFDFEFENGTAAKDVISLASLNKQNDGTYDFYSVNPSDLTAPDLLYNYFDGEEDYLDMLSASARATADYMIDNITVMDTVVKLYDTYYILTYDYEKDVLTVIVYTEESGVITNISNISIYYDKDGDETVEMTTYDKTGYAYEVNYVYYTANKKYTISRGSVAIDGSSDGYYTTSAIKQNGMWRAVSSYFSTNNVLFTKNGTYDYGNGLLYLTFLVENEDNVYTFTDTMRPFRDGGETGSSVVAQPTDEIRIVPYTAWLPGVYVDIAERSGGVDINASILTGWDECRITIDSEWEMEQSYAEHYFYTENDFIRLSNGEIVAADGFVWSKEYGIGTSFTAPSGTYFVDKYGNEHKIDNGFVAVRFGGSLAHINRDINKFEQAFIFVNGGLCNESYASKFAMISEFFKEYGLGFIDAVSDDLFGDLSTLMLKRDGYANGIFEELYGVKYSFDEYKTAMFSVKSSLDSFYAEITDTIAKYKGNGVVDFDNQPKRPTDIGLIPLTSNLTGNVIVSANGISFEGISVNINKNMILSKDSSYTVISALVSATDIITLDAFNTVKYNDEAMSFTGKSVALPTTLDAGKYTLVAYVAKVTEDANVRLSEITALTATEFATVENTIAVDGGSYKYKYYYENGAVIFESIFTDTEAPVITVDGLAYDSVGKCYTIVYSSLTVMNLLELVSATDSRDGDIDLDLTNVTLKDSESKVYEDTEVKEGDVFVITVSDAAGNTASVEIKAIAAPTVPEEDGDQQKTS